MSKDSDSKIVRRRWDEIPKRTQADIDRIAAIRDEDIDYSDIPQFPGGERLYRDASGKLVKRKNFIREAIIEAMTAQGMTNYALWKASTERCPTITETAIGQFVKGQRSIGIEYLEAIMLVLGLSIVKRSTGEPAAAREEIKQG